MRLPGLSGMSVAVKRLVDVRLTGKDGRPLLLAAETEALNLANGTMITFKITDYKGEACYGIQVKWPHQDWDSSRSILFHEPTDLNGFCTDYSSFWLGTNLTEDLLAEECADCDECGGSGLRGGFHVRCSRGGALV